MNNDGKTDSLITECRGWVLRIPEVPSSNISPETSYPV